MKLFNEYFLGVILIVAGAALVIKEIFNLQIPVIRVVLGTVFIYLGIAVIYGGQGLFTGFKTENMILFSQSRIELKETNRINKEYIILFSKGVIDLSQLPTDALVEELEIVTIFADSRIKINEDANVSVRVSSAFGRAETPDNTVITFGDHHYVNRPSQEPGGKVNIKTTVVFGSLKVE